MTTIKIQFYSNKVVPKNYTGTVIYQAGSIEYCSEYLVNGLLHREDGPAYETTESWPCGKQQQYWLNGELQRIVRNGSTWWQR